MIVAHSSNVIQQLGSCKVLRCVPETRQWSPPEDVPVDKKARTHQLAAGILFLAHQLRPARANIEGRHGSAAANMQGSDLYGLTSITHLINSARLTNQ